MTRKQKERIGIIPSRISKVVYIGEAQEGSIHCKIKYNDGKLSISGVVGAKKNGDCTGSCWQIDDTIRKELETISFSKEWDKVKAFHFLEIWKEYHLNNMKAGTPAQEDFIKKWEAQGNVYSYDKVCEALKENNLYNDNGYVYGTAWLSIEIPDKELKFLNELPEASKACNWEL